MQKFQADRLGSSVFTGCPFVFRLFSKTEKPIAKSKLNHNAPLGVITLR